MKNVTISVVIPALNEEKYIMNALEGLKKQTYKNFEEIVVDGNSTDRTRTIAKKYAHVVIEKKKGIGRGRNRGASLAKGNIIVFLDADSRPAPNLLKTYSDAFKNNNIVAATGPILPLENSSRRVRMGFKLVSVYSTKISILIGKPAINGINFAVRKDAFDKVGGFNDKFMTYEDWDLSYRLKKLGKIKYLDDAVVYTSVRRIKKWGIFGFFVYHVGNIFRYYLLKNPKEQYEQIR